jgi:hypothetical protein
MISGEQQLDDITPSIAEWLSHGHMQHLGIANTMNLAHAYHLRRFGREDEWRRRLYREQRNYLLESNGGLTRPPIEVHDGWAIDTSMTLPHLDQVLADADRIISERAGQPLKAHGSYRSYFQILTTPEDATTCPSLLDFATSSDVLAVVGRYLQCIPVLSTTLPPGIRLVESNQAFDAEPDRPKDSQLFHMDYYSVPNLYVIVLLQDTTPEHGPWTFLPRAISQKVRRTLGYWEQGRPYRLSDEEIYSVVDRDDVIPLTYPRGTVLFIESSGCFHYGSRNSIRPRFQLMYGFTGVCRTDFSELIMEPDVYPVRESDSLLRRLVLDKHMLPRES